MFVRTSKKITNHSKTFSAPELIGQLGKALAQGHNISVGIWKMVAPLRIVIITKTDPLKKSLPKFAQPGAGWVGPVKKSPCTFEYHFDEH